MLKEVFISGLAGRGVWPAGGLKKNPPQSLKPSSRDILAKLGKLSSCWALVFADAFVLHQEHLQNHGATRRSLKVGPRGPAIPNILHRYLLLLGTDRALVKNRKWS